MILLAVDPGKTTGYAVWSGGEFLFADQCPLHQFLEWAEETIPMYAVWELQVVSEKFTIGPQTMSRSKDAHWAIGANQILEYWCTRHDVPYSMQSPAKAKGFSTDAKLKTIGWWSPSPGGHKNDAVRHLIVRLVDLKQLDASELVTQRVQ